MNLFHLLRVYSLGFFLQEKIKVFLTLLGIASGVAIYCAIQGATENAWLGFAESSKLIAGDDDYQLVSQNGEVAEELIPNILALREVAAISPQSSTFVSATVGDRTLGMIQVIGLDLFSPTPKPRSQNFRDDSRNSIVELLRSPQKAIVSESLAKELGENKLQLRINGREVQMEVLSGLSETGLSKAFGGRVIVVDISSFQDLFSTWGKVGLLKVYPKASLSKEALANVLAPVLPQGVALAEPGKNLRQAEKMSEAFRLNLLFLSGISLFVALFLIYNTVSFLALKRRQDLSILRSIGASSRQVFILLSTEAFVLGLLASVLGLALGYLMAEQAVKLISASFTTLYMPVRVNHIELSRSLIVQSLLLGPALSLLGSIPAILEVITSAPRETSSYQRHELNFVKKLPLLTASGMILFLLAAVFAQPRLLKSGLWMGFISPTALLFGTTLVLPACLWLSIRGLRRIFSGSLSVESLLAFDHIQSTLRRSSFAVSAVAIALSMYIGMTLMILSFRHTVEGWIEQITRADIYIGPGQSIGIPEPGFLPDQVVSELLKLENLDDYDWVSTRKISMGERQIKVNGIRFETLARHNRLLLQSPLTPEQLSNLAREPNVVLVSEPFAQRMEKRIGDSVTVPGLKGPWTARIANIFYDYSSDQGVIMLPDTIFESLFGERRRQGFSLYLKPGTDVEAVRSKIETMFPDYRLSVRSNRRLREEVLKIFDDTFRITYALQAIALIVSGLTVMNTTLMLVLERKREFAVMRALGARGQSIIRMVVSEALILGLAGILAASVLGVLLALLLVFVVNKFFFGWSVHFEIAFGIFGTTALITAALSVLSAYLPGKQMLRRLDGQSLRYE